jgi:hypothetical protein
MSLFDGQLKKPKQRAAKKTSSGSSAYGKGKIKFEDVSDSFKLCYCNRGGSQTDPRYGHPYHVEELATFEL